MAAKRLGCYVTVMLLLNMECQGQQCTMGFIFPVFQCCGDRAKGDPVTRIIPDMNFTCNGTVTHWWAAGRFRNNRDNHMIYPVLSIWRERSSELGTYDRVDTGIELGRCGDEEEAPSVIGMNDVYECNLTQSDHDRVTVQPRDVIGIELPIRRNTRFRLYFDDNNGGPINYEFRGHSTTISTVNLSHSSSTSRDQPLISLTIMTTVPVLSTTLAQISEVSTPDVTITQSPTTTTTTTEASSTDLTTTQPLTTMEALSMAVTHPSITTAIAIDAQTNNIQTSSMSTTESLPMSETATHSLTTATGPNSVVMNLRQPNRDLRLIIGSAVGAMVGIILLSVLFAILVLLVVYQSRKHKRHLGERETRIDMAQYDNTVNNVIETKANDSYIPVLCQISTEDNIAYGEIVNQDNNNINLYEIVDQSVEANTAQLTHKEHTNESTTEYDYVNNDYV